MQIFDQSIRDELIRSIKGYQGYSSTEHRTKTDQKFRNFLLTKLNSTNQRLPEFEKRIKNIVTPDISESLKRIRSGINMLTSPLKNPCYIDQLFFKKDRISDEKLSQLYKYDIQIIEQVEIFEDEIKQLDTENDDQEITQILNHLYDLTDGLNQAITEREFLIMSD